MDIMLVFETSGVGSIPARPAKNLKKILTNNVNSSIIDLYDCKQTGKAPSCFTR